MPVKRDDYFYYTRTEEGKAYSIQCRKRGSLDAPEEILLDSNVLAEGQKYFRLGNFAVSPDHRLLAYSTDLEGDETYTIQVKNLSKPASCCRIEIPNTYYTLEWANDNRTFFYTVLDEAKRPYRAFRHELGAAIGHAGLSGRRRAIQAGLSARRAAGDSCLSSSRVRLRPNCATWRRTIHGGEFRVLLPRRQGVEYDASHHGEYFYIRTNDRAKNFRLMRTEVGNPSREDVARSDSGARRRDHRRCRFIRRSPCRFTNASGVSRRFAFAMAPAAFSHYIDFPEPVYTVGATGNAEYKTNLLRFNYTSLVTPVSVFDYNVRTRDARIEEAIRSTRRLRCVAIPIRAHLRKGARWRGSPGFVGVSQGISSAMERVRCCSTAMELTVTASIRGFRPIA